MANDYQEVWNSVLLRAPVDPAQAQRFVFDAFQEFAERREWSWLIRNSAFAPPNLYQTGIATATPNSAIVTGSADASGNLPVWTTAMIGRQFRFGIFTPIYTITAVDSPTQIVLDQPWVGQVTVSQSYLLYQAYYSTPADFREWLTLKDPQNNFKLHTNVMQPQLDFWDPQRSQNQTPRCVSFLDYGGGLNGSQGSVGPIIQAGGTQGDPAPVATTTFGYNYPADATYCITITTGGAPGGALAFKWYRVSNGVSTTLSPAITVADNNPVDLSDGVQVYFPQATYVLNDVFITNCQQNQVQPQTSPRYEMWPHPMTQVYYYPFLYVAKIPAFDSDNQQLPPFVRRDVILELALEKCALFPGVSADAPNPYFSLQLAQMHRQRYEVMAMELEKKDDATAIRDFVYQDQTPWAPMPFMDGSWLRDHAIPPGSW